MGSTSDKVSGIANKVAGTIKQGVGKAVGSERLEAEGHIQEAKGKVQTAVGDAKSAVKDGAKKASDFVSKKL
jgi:uncharacterized protein YjbJ (UPF0337 family)